MITEFAYLQIDPEARQPFEAAVETAKPIFESAKGCLGMRLSSVIEHPGKYVLQVDWSSVEAHEVDFRSSEGFQKWRGLVGAFFIKPPTVEHIETTKLF
jgi:quinol monooxygenase YgiN